MKRFTALTMAALMVFAAFTAVAAADTVEVRGEVVSGNNIWDASTFAGFWYDLDADDSSETLMINQVSGVIAEGAGMVYTATAVAGQEPEYAFTVSSTSPTLYTYSKLGLFAEEYFAVDDDVDTLSEILMDDDNSRTMRTGEALELGEGYALTPQQIDVDGNKVWLELTKDGEFVKDKIISTSGNASQANKTWFYDQDVADTEDVVTLMVHIDEVFQGQVDSLCVIKGVFQISDEALEIESDDEFGELEVTSVANPSIVMKNTDELDIPDDEVLDITDELKVRGNDGATLWYLFTEVTIAGEEEVEEEEEEEEEEEVEEEVGEEEAGEEEAGEEEAGEEETGEEEAGEEEAGEEEAGEEETGEEEAEDPGTPGFEAIFAIAGLLAIAYLVRRN